MDSGPSDTALLLAVAERDMGAFRTPSVRTFPAPGAGGPSSDTVWWIALAVCAVAIAVPAGGRRLLRAGRLRTSS